MFRRRPDIAAASTVVHFHFQTFSAEGSKFVEEAAAGNVKRTWVNYGVQRNFFDAQQVSRAFLAAGLKGCCAQLTVWR